MRDYKKLVRRLRKFYEADIVINSQLYILLESADAIEELRRDLKDCRNELCLKCGEYKQRHLGACDGCRWKEPIE